MKKTIGPILIVVAIVLGVLGFQNYNNSGGSVEVAGIELSAKNETKQNRAYIYFGLSVISLIAGVSVLRSN